MRIIVDKPGTIPLGKQGENGAREVAFPEPGAWAEEFPGGVVQLLVRPPGGCGPAEPVVLEQDGGMAVWTVTAADTARAGYGRCELRWSVDGLAVKSRTYVTFVAEGLSGGDRHCACGPTTGPAAHAPPGCGCGGDNWGAYLERIVQAGADALNAASRAEQAAGRAEAAGGGTGVEIAADEEVREMLEEVFGAAEEDRVAADEEIDEMLDEVFGPHE